MQCHKQAKMHGYNDIAQFSSAQFWFARQCMLRRKSKFTFSSRSAVRTTAYRQTRLQYGTSGFCIINAWLELKCLPLLMILCHLARWPYSQSNHLEFMLQWTKRNSITTKVVSTHSRELLYSNVNTLDTVLMNCSLLARLLPEIAK